MAEDGVHVASRESTEKHCNDAVSIVELGTNIGATEQVYPYFLHSFIDGGAIDSGIYFKNNSWHIFASGSITNGWTDTDLSNVKAGDTIMICSRLSGNQFLTEIKKNGKTVGTLYAGLSTSRANKMKTQGSTLVREMNIAGHKNINNENAFFSWSTFKETTITNVSNKSVKMTNTNSSLRAVYYDITSFNHSNVGCDRGTPTVVNGYVVDKAWCRCNNK